MKKREGAYGVGGVVLGCAISFLALNIYMVRKRLF